jgi:tetratricopeptide (TPR) repeat protein
MCADLWEKAADCLERAGARALERSAYREAIELYEQTLLALAKLPDLHAGIDRVFDIHLSLRTAHGASGNVNRMAQHLRAARDLASRAADSRKAVLVQCLCTSLLGLHENVDAALTAIEAASVGARRDGYMELLPNAAVSLSILYALRGRYRQGADVVQRELAHSDGAARHERYGMTATWTVLMTGTGAMHEAQVGDHAHAMQWAREAVLIARETARPFDVAIALVMQGTAALWRGDLAHAVAALTEAHDICLARSIGILQPNVIPALAYAHALDGRVSDAARLVGPWLPTAKLGGPPFWLHGWGFAFAGLAGAAVGDARATLTYLEGPLELVRAHAMPGLEPALLRARAACQRAVGDGCAAGADLRRALDLSRSHAMAVEQAQCNLALGQLLLDEGETDEGRALLESARTAMLAMDMPFWARLAREGTPLRLAK